MQRRTLLRFTLAAGAGLALAGCGFQLRRPVTTTLPFTSLAVDGQDDDVTRLAIERLQAAGVDVDSAASQVLNLGRATYNEQRLNVLNSGSQEYDMSLNVAFSVQRREDGAYRISQQRLEARERFTINSGNLLSADDKRTEVQQRLRREAVDQLLHRLQSLDD